MKDRVDPVLVEVREQTVPGFPIRQQNVEEMEVPQAIFGRHGQPQQPFTLKRLEELTIALMDDPAPLADLVEHFQLSKEKRRADLAGHIRRADIHPGIFVNLAAEELAAVGPLVADDLRPIDQFGIVDAQSAPLAADVVLGLVKAVRAQIADRAQAPGHCRTR